MDEGGAESNPAGRTRTVFISYASADTAVANAIVECVERRGISCWIAPRDVVPGSLYADEIVGAINDAECLALVLSQHSIASPHVGRELERASSKRRRILALRLDAAPLTRSFEYFLSESQWIEVGAGGADAAGAKVAAAVQRHRNPPPARTAQSGSVAPGDQRRIAGKRPLLVGSLVVLSIAVAILVAATVPRPWSGLGHLPDSVATAPAVPDATTVPGKSVAVLPFVDMSEHHDEEYFSDGLAEELIDRLAQAPDLRVVARTSSFFFKGKQATIAEIARTLQIANVLEGSVRRSGKTVRISVQLVRAADGFNLWSHSYDRDISDIFKVQDEIATAVVKASQAALGALGAREPIRPEAYSLLLQADYYSHGNTRQDLERAVGYAKEALRIDPSAVDAWVRLSLTYSHQAHEGYVERGRGYALAHEAATRAVRLSPDSPAAHASMAYALMDLGDFAGARGELQQAEALPSPGSRVVANARGIFELNLGHWQSAVQVYRQALASDPLNPVLQENIADAYGLGGKHADAVAAWRAAIDLEPRADELHAGLALALVRSYQLQDALGAARLETSEAARLAALAVISAALGDGAQSAAMLETLEKRFSDSRPDLLVDTYAAVGRRDRAFEMLDKLAAARDPFIYQICADPSLLGLHDDPRWRELVRSLGLLQ